MTLGPMTRHDMWQVDAFTDELFAGNPAAVMVLDAFLPDATLQAIAAENNLAETAFLVPTGAGTYQLRWFTPTTEVRLCGHATLAASHILWTELEAEAEVLRFSTLSGELRVSREGSGYAMDFPADDPTPIAVPNGLIAALGAGPVSVHAGQYILAVMKDADAVRKVSPDFRALAAVQVSKTPDENCVVVTAEGDTGSDSDGGADFISRFFGPTVGVDEDPVTGSAHCMLAPYWARMLGKATLSAVQASRRSGKVQCTVEGDRVILRGQAVTYLRGQIDLPAATD